jgi:hypothetical protein
VICVLKCGFVGRGSGWLLHSLYRCWPWLTPAPGTVVARTPSRPDQQARVCLAAPPPTFTTLTMPSARASDDSRHVLLSP